MFMFAELWMVGVQRVPHSNQNTQGNIESYHGALKRWLALDTKGLRGRRIDWLVWWLSTTIARHYMHTLKMKKKGFTKKKLWRPFITWNVEKVALIPLTHVYHPTLESDGAWGVQSQRFPNVIYVVKFPFTKIFCCTCEWALRRNMCKHQIVVILTCTDISQEDIIHYLWNMVSITSWRVASHVCGPITYSKWYGVQWWWQRWTSWRWWWDHGIWWAHEHGTKLSPYGCHCKV